jgi:hypothetical protein
MTLLIAHTHAFCFYNKGSKTIWLIGSGRVSNNGDGIFQADLNGESFLQSIPPGQKACWYNGGQSGPCATLSYYATLSLTKAPGAIQYTLDRLYTQEFQFFSGDGVVFDIDNNWEIDRYPNSSCGPEPALNI